MKSYKDPSFQERVGRAAEAKQKALDALRSRPPVDEAAAAERQAARQRREAAQAEKRAAKLAAEQAAKDARKAKAAEEAKAATASIPKLQTEAERKQARDARYAARKNRK